MRIVIFGSTGMLGNYVQKYFTLRYYDVLALSRKDLDLYNATKDDILALGLNKDDIVINCAGLIKQRAAVKNSEFIIVNSLFPHLLAEVCEDVGSKLIHITTDCVFSGKDGLYTEGSLHDATDIYGQSKSLGEPKSVTVVRTSIIGEETSGFLSLLEWVKAQAGKQVNGFIDHFWNGITCLQFAELCELIIDKGMFWKGVKHVFSPEVISKYDLVRLISDIYSLDLDVLKYESGNPCDRSLASIRDGISIDVPDLNYQLIIMKQFGEN